MALLLGIAYAASVGGLSTITGTPPNLFIASFIRDRLWHDIARVQWMLLAMPLVAVLAGMAPGLGWIPSSSSCRWR